MLIQFCRSCPLGFAVKLNFNTSKGPLLVRLKISKLLASICIYFTTLCTFPRSLRIRNHLYLSVSNAIGGSVMFLSQRIKESIMIFKVTEVFSLFVLTSQFVTGGAKFFNNLEILSDTSKV